MYINNDSKNMPRSDRAAQSQLVLEKRKELAAKLLQRSSKPPVTTDPEVVPPGTPEAAAATTPPPHKAVSDARPVALGLKLWSDDGQAQLRVVTAVEHLAGQMLHAAESGISQVFLLWPGSIRALGLAHAVATAARWQQGNKQGLRTLLYPAKANFLQTLNHAHIDRLDLIRLAQRLVETGGERTNGQVTVSLPAKDAFWFSLNSIKTESEQIIHPSMAELLPHFFADKDFQQWRACDGDLLRHVKARLKDRAHRHSLSDLTIRSLSDIATAPDALFAISWKASQPDIRAALRKLRNGQKPDVLVLDATRSLRKDNPSWKVGLVRFLECAREVWPTAMPSVLIVTDEPHVRNQLRQELEKRAAKGGEAASWLLRSGLPIQGAICSVSRDGLVAHDHLEPLRPVIRDIQVAIVDTEAATVIELLDRLRAGVTEPKWAQAMDAASTYLARLAALPSSTRALVNWLGEADVPMAVRESYSWPVYRSKLEEILHDPAFGDRQRLQRGIERGNVLWQNYENGTPLARKLADLIEEHTRGTEKCCVAFTRPTARRLAERYFETYDGYPEGAGFEVLRDCVRFVVSRNLAAQGEIAERETLVMAGLDEESLRLLLLDDRVSSPAYVLLTRRNAAYLRATLKAIRLLPSFAALSTRINSLLNQLPEFPDIDERALFNRSDFVLPAFSFEQGLSASVTEHEDQDSHAWELMLEGGLVVRRSPLARAYLYDPTLSHTLSRGFRGVDVSQVQEGDRIFVMSFELRELTELALREAGIPVSTDKRFENDLREYHKRIAALVAILAGSSLTEKARSVYAAVAAIVGPKGQMPAESTVKSWMDVERFRSLSFDEAKPGAPRQESHFKAFAKALALDEFEAVYFWKAVIRPLRGVRRADGRRVSDVYTELLLEPESAVVHRRLKQQVVDGLFTRAKENVHVIEAIRKPLGDAKDD